MARFTSDMAYNIYNSITSGDEAFVKQIAEQALVTAVEVQTDMFRDSEPGVSPPDDNDIRNHAIAFATDMINDFRDNLVRQLTEMKFAGNIKLVQTIESNLRFE